MLFTAVFDPHDHLIVIKRYYMNINVWIRFSDLFLIFQNIKNNFL